MAKDKANGPNILWVCTDSQRWDTLGCYGNSWVHTPHADRLAGEGVRFTHAYAQNPLCQPSRGCFLTGRYPVTTRLRQNGTDIPKDEVLVTRRFDEAGYVCGLVGKLHLSACDHRIVERPQEDDPEACFRGTERRIRDGYAEFHWDHCPVARYRSSAFTQWVEAQGGSFERPAREDCRWVRHGMPEALHQTTWCFDTAAGFVRRYRDSRYPWVLTINPFEGPDGNTWSIYDLACERVERYRPRR